MTSRGRRNLPYAALMAMSLLAAGNCLGESSEGFSLPVVDERSGAPLAGVHAVQVVTTEWGGGLEERRGKQLAIFREATSDASGKLTFGPRTFVVDPSKPAHRIRGGAIFLFKPGYCYGVWGDRRTTPDVDGGVVRWTSSWHPAMKLRPCADRVEALRDLTDDVAAAGVLAAYLASEDYGFCGWRSTPQFLVAVESERWRLLHGYRAPMRQTPLDTQVYSPFLGKVLSEPRALSCGKVEELVAQVIVPCPGSGERMQQVSWRSHERPPLGKGDYSPPVLTGRCPSTGTHWHFQDARGWESSPKPIPNEWRNWGLPDPPPSHPSRPR